MISIKQVVSALVNPKIIQNPDLEFNIHYNLLTD